MKTSNTHTQAILHAEALDVGFDNQPPTVQGVSFALYPEKTLALVGESGSGKSLTALSLLQLLPRNTYVGKDSHIYFQGRDLLDCSEAHMQTIRGKAISMIFQDALSALNPVRTVQQQITEILSRHTSLPTSQHREKAAISLEEVGISDSIRCLSAYPHELSGGMKQRVMIAMALAAQPSVLIADEPTTALDVTLQARILGLLQSLQKKYRMGLLIISHDLALVSQIADEVAVMYQGRIVEKNTASAFFQRPQHEYSRLLLNASPDIYALLKPTRASQPTSLSMPTNHPPLLVVEKLSTCFAKRQKAVDNISFTLRAGKTLALVGESGSGKTTTARNILQLLPYTAQRIEFAQQSLQYLKGRALTAFRRQVQMIFQDPYSSLNPRKTIEESLLEGLRTHGIGHNKRDRLERVVRLMESVELDPAWRNRYPHAFSGGQRQRICIARALSLEPKLLVCDEPTSALDVSVQAQILTLLKKVQERLGLTYLLITHDFGVVATLADTVAVMYKGRIVEQGPTQDILLYPQHAYTRGLLAALPRIPR